MTTLPSLGHLILGLTFLAGIFDIVNPQEIVGGYSEVSDEEANAAARKAAFLYNSQQNDLRHYTLSYIIRAQRQLVAGTNWILVLVLAETDCVKSQVPLTGSICNYRTGGQQQRCSIHMFEPLPHTNQPTLIKETRCWPFRFV